MHIWYLRSRYHICIYSKFVRKKRFSLVFQVSDRRKMRFTSKIPLKTEICCNFGGKIWWEISTNPQERSRKSDKNDEKWWCMHAMMMRFHEIEHKSVIKCDKMWWNCEKIAQIRRKWWNDDACMRWWWWYFMRFYEIEH